MPGLILKLRAHEEVLINGVRMQNGPRSARLVIMTPDVNILRLRDALDPEETDTPVKRVCHLAQQAVAGETAPEAAAVEIGRGIAHLLEAFRGLEGAEEVAAAEARLQEGNIYGVFRALRRLVPVEARLLAEAEAAGAPPRRETG